MKACGTTVFAIGRWMPIHLGHKAFLVKLAREFDRLVIGIGSCYENGTPRNCIPAVEREKLLRQILKADGISNVIIIPVQDRPTFEEWINDVCHVCEKYQVTHFCTGNKEDILDVMERQGIRLDVEMINPELDSDFPYHATDIRNAILAGAWDRLDTMIPAEIKPTVLTQVSKEIQAASRGEGQEFVPGRQTVDMVFTVSDASDGKTYLLVGKRNMEKVDFPGAWAIPGGGIEEFESPIDAVARCFYAEAGVRIRVIDNAYEPTRVILDNLGGVEADMHFVGIYASRDERINGTRGGGSQCFAVNVDGSVDEVARVLCSTHDMDELKLVDIDSVHGITLAFDQKRMVYDALIKMGVAFDKGEMLERYDVIGAPLGKGISRKRAHAEGILHGASHIYIGKWEQDKLWFLLQRRSLGKDSYPGCLDVSSAGHVEQGSDFLETAQKELLEELGISVSASELIELFTQSVDLKSEFRGKVFVDREVNKIYLLKKDLVVSELDIQREELSEVLWMPAEDILKRLENGDGELCIVLDEFKKVMVAIQEKRFFNNFSNKGENSNV